MPWQSSGIPGFATQTTRHEYIGGEIFAMGGAGDAHVTLALNVAMALRRHLDGTPCRTFITDMQLRVEAADAFFHPDVMVTCSVTDASDRLVKREPVTLAELLVGPLQANQEALAQRYQRALSAFELVPLGAEVAVQAARLCVRYRLKLPDAFQLACALAAGAHAMVTHDRDYAAVKGLVILSGEGP